MELIEHLGGAADPAAPAPASQLAVLMRREVARGLAQIAEARAGYDRPLVLAAAALPGQLVVLLPVDARTRTDAGALAGHPRAGLIVAAAIEALALAADLPPVSAAAPLCVTYGALDEALVVAAPWPRRAPPTDADAELVALQLDERLASTDRLRARGVLLPAAAARLLLSGVGAEPAIGHRHPLTELEVLVRAGLSARTAASSYAGGDAPPADRGAAAALLDRVLGPVAACHRPHEDPDPARRIARRILQMLAGKRKWSGGTGAGFHTELAHLTRGFDGTDRELAAAVVGALLEAGLLVEKLSVGQRHVSLLSRRASDITSLIETGTVPDDLHLPHA